MGGWPARWRGRAHESLRPPEPLDVVEAGVGELPSQFRVAGRVVPSSLQFAGEWLRRHPTSCANRTQMDSHLQNLHHERLL